VLSTGGNVTTVSLPKPGQQSRAVLIIIDLLQAAMDTGTALATVVIFFCLSYTGVKLVWWGNTVGKNTNDYLAVPWLKVPTGGYFGKGPGQF